MAFIFLVVFVFFLPLAARSQTQAPLPPGHQIFTITEIVEIGVRERGGNIQFKFMDAGELRSGSILCHPIENSHFRYPGRPGTDEETIFFNVDDGKY